MAFEKLSTIAGTRSRSRSEFADIINRALSQQKQIQDEPRLTSMDLFGPQMQRLIDSARQSGNAAKQAFSRSLLAGGGDLSGAGAASFLETTGQTNRDISDIGLRFSTLADRINRERQGRGDRLLQLGLTGQQNLLTLDQNILEAARNRNLQESQARKGRNASVVGSALTALGTVLAFCWVAEELYGKDDFRVHAIRNFLSEHEGTDGMIGRFAEQYRKEGRQWAIKVKRNKVVRAQARRLYDELYELAMAA